MATDMLMKIDGIKGESKIDKHADEIDVESFSWGMTQSGSAHSGGGAGTGKVSVHDLNFTKIIDKSTPDLMAFCCSGKHIANAKLTCRKAGENPLDFLVITMEDVFITSVQSAGNHGQDRPVENVSLNFARVKVEYAAQDAKGGAADKPKMGWDIEANKKI